MVGVDGLRHPSVRYWDREFMEFLDCYILYCVNMKKMGCFGWVLAFGFWLLLFGFFLVRLEKYYTPGMNPTGGVLWEKCTA